MTNPSEDQVRKVAEGLTYAQRRAIQKDGRYVDRISIFTHRGVHSVLQRKGLVGPEAHSCRLTPLGLAVRQHLLSDQSSRGRDHD